MVTLEQVNKLAVEAENARRKWINARFDLEARELLPKAKALVGTFWKYRNCYSCPREESDYFWTYMRVIRVNDSGHVTYRETQIDKFGVLTVRQETTMARLFGPLSNDKWQKIGKREFMRAAIRAQTMAFKLNRAGA